MADNKPAIGTLGVIGGMGPAATVDFMRRIVEATPARRDQDHLHVIVDSDPSVPDRTAAILREGPDPSPWLATMARRLELAGADMLVMPCNSAHGFAGAILSAVDIPLLDWPAVVADRAIAQGATKIGLLATDGTLASGIYRSAFATPGCAVIEPSAEAQKGVMSIITAIKAGAQKNSEARQQVRRVSTSLVRQGADLLLLACTELSVLAAAGDLINGIAVVDASDVVARHVVELAYPQT